VKYLVIIEEAEGSFGAYVPDLPGCVAVGESRDEALELIQDAIEMHLADMKERGLPLPEPVSTSELVAIGD